MYAAAKELSTDGPSVKPPSQADHFVIDPEGLTAAIAVSLDHNKPASKDANPCALVALTGFLRSL